MEVSVDIWRDSPLRYLGYANEIGESFRYISPMFYKPSYALAIGYVLGDVQDKTMKQYRLENNKITPMLMCKLVDAFVWQMLASVCIPGLVINRVVEGCTWTLGK